MSVDIGAIRSAAEKAGHYSVSWSVPDRDYRFDKSVPVGDFAQLDNDDVEQGQGETLARYIAKLDPQTVLALCDLAERTATPLAEDVQAAVRELEAWAGNADVPSKAIALLMARDVDAIITALHAATAERAALTAQNAALREALGYLSQRSETFAEDVDESENAGPVLDAWHAAMDAAQAALADPNPRAEALLRLAADPDVQVMEELLALPGLERVCWDRGEWDAEWRVNGKLYGEEGYLSPVDLLAMIREKVKGE